MRVSGRRDKMPNTCYSILKCHQNLLKMIHGVKKVGNLCCRYVLVKIAIEVKGFDVAVGRLRKLISQ